MRVEDEVPRSVLRIGVARAGGDVGEGVVHQRCCFHLHLPFLVRGSVVVFAVRLLMAELNVSAGRCVDGREACSYRSQGDDVLEPLDERCSKLLGALCAL